MSPRHYIKNLSSSHPGGMSRPLKDISPQQRQLQYLLRRVKRNKYLPSSCEMLAGALNAWTFPTVNAITPTRKSRPTFKLNRPQAPVTTERQLSNGATIRVLHTRRPWPQTISRSSGHPSAMPTGNSTNDLESSGTMKLTAQRRTPESSMTST